MAASDDRNGARTLKSRAVALLARREYGRAELRRKLLAGGTGEAGRAAEVDAVLDELAARGLLSDERYAQALAGRKARTHARRAIVEALEARGVARETAKSAVEATAVADDETLLREVWARRFSEPPRDDRERARQVRFLQSRGFALSAILRWMRELRASGGSDPSDE